MIPIAIVAVLELWVAWWAPWWFGWLPGWAGLATGWVALAYAVHRPRMLGKLDAPRLAAVALLPYLATSRGVARAAQRAGLAERAEVVPGLWVGGWPKRGPSPLAHVDCTAELPLRATPLAHRCVPMLDGTGFAADDWADAVTQALSWRRAGRDVLVHCAYGHGRSVAVVIGVLLAEGRAPTVEAALGLVQVVRRGARLIPPQRAALEAALSAHPPETLRERARAAE